MYSSGKKAVMAVFFLAKYHLQRDHNVAREYIKSAYQIKMHRQIVITIQFPKPFLPVISITKLYYFFAISRTLQKHK